MFIIKSDYYVPMSKKERRTPGLECKADGHIVDSTYELGYLLIDREAEDPPRYSDQIVEELDSLGIRPGKISSSPGHRPVKVWF